MRKLFGNTKLAFEDRLVRIVLIGFAFPLLVALVLVFSSELSGYLSVLLSFIMLVAVAFTAFAIRQQVIFQLRTSTNLVEAMIAGDYSLRANNKDIDGALADFNQLLNGLADQLTQQSLITREQQILLEKVTDQIDVAIVAVDHDNNISLMNPAAESLFRERFDELEGWPAKSLGLQNVVKEALENGVRKVTEFEIDRSKRKVYVRTDQYFVLGKQQILIFITDIQNLLREEERLAWQKLLRVLSHEINNSLTPIASISETLNDVLENRPKQDHHDMNLQQTMQEGLSVISERAHSLNHFIQDYRQLTHLPLPNKTVFDAKSFVQKITQLFEHSKFVLPEESISLFADGEQLQQALVNLFKNAEEANVANNVQDSEISINWARLSNMVHIEVLDKGVGINNPENIFVPFYTTKKKGSGIGLTLSRQIALNHGGDLSLENNSKNSGDNSTGAKATLMLPIAAEH
jgi:nitrogen fixation/metabolism regulation signal transduction histidine kinase